MCGFQYHGCFTNCSSWKQILNIWKLPIQNKNYIFLYICLSFKMHNNLKNNNYTAFFQHLPGVNSPHQSPYNVFLERKFTILFCVYFRTAIINMIQIYSQSKMSTRHLNCQLDKNLASYSLHIVIKNNDLNKIQDVQQPDFFQLLLKV